MLDLYAYRNELKSNLLYRWQCLDLESQALDWAWIQYAFVMSHAVDTQLIANSFQQSLRWVELDSTWSAEGNWGAIGLLCHSLHQEEYSNWEAIAERLTQGALLLSRKSLSKYSRLNDPDLVYGIIVGGNPKFPDELRRWLQEHCLRNSREGNWRRRMLFSAASIVLGAMATSLDDFDPALYELPCALWFSETYASHVEESFRRDRWELLTKVKEQILLAPPEIDAIHSELLQASNIDAAMLYLAVMSRTQGIDPITLFRSIPLHPRIRQAAESLFLNGEYVNAVLEAAKVLIDEIKHKAGYPADLQGKPLDGRSLIQRVFSSKNPILRFNALTTQSEVDEHEGLKLIAEGIVAAIRNPKGHDPKDKIVLSSYEAIDQLVIVSYVCRRVDAAHT